MGTECGDGRQGKGAKDRSKSLGVRTGHKGRLSTQICQAVSRQMHLFGSKTCNSGCTDLGSSPNSDPLGSKSQGN